MSKILGVMFAQPASGNSPSLGYRDVCTLSFMYLIVNVVMYIVQLTN
jgi:hypothetical protein